MFTACKPEPLELIRRLADKVDVQDGYTLMRQGDIAREFFLIVDGKVRIERDGKTLKTLGPGDYLGEVALLSESPRIATAVTEGPAKLMVITHQGFNSLMDSSPAIRLAIFEGVAAYLRNLVPDSAG